MSATHPAEFRPLDAPAIALVVALCLSWGFDQVAVKLAIHDIPPLLQSTARSFIAALLVGTWARLRGIALFKRDGTLPAGIVAGVLFALQFLLVYRGLIWTTATRGVLFIYLSPFFVVVGSRWFIPGDGWACCCPSSASSSPSACRPRPPIRTRYSAML
jgi:drug/metabolite transporter (DMT)-like permease